MSTTAVDDIDPAATPEEAELSRPSRTRIQRAKNWIADNSFGVSIAFLLVLFAVVSSGRKSSSPFTPANKECCGGGLPG